MESYQELKDKKILVLGFSKTGIAAVDSVRILLLPG